MFRTLLMLIGLIAAGTACAQTATPPPARGVNTVQDALNQLNAAPAGSQESDPALWVVKDRDTTIYLFGTIHVLKPGLSWFDAAVKAAFDRSDALVLEMVQPDTVTMQKLVVAKGFTPDGPTLTERLPEADRAPYLKALSDLGVPPVAFDRAKPWVVATNLTLLPLMKSGYRPDSGPEHVLTAAAQAVNKPVLGLETPEQQIGYLADLPDPLQVKFLESTLKDLPKADADMAKMVDAWSHGDPAKLGEIMNDGVKDTPELAKVLLTDRNARWAQWIRARLATPGTVFVAVGAGHLAGKGSVQEQLRALNITATRIAY